MQGSPSGCWVKVFVLQGVNDPPLLERAGRKTRLCSEDINALRGNLRSFPFLRRWGAKPWRSPWRRAGFIAYGIDASTSIPHIVPMKLDKALLRYREDRFTDDDITCCAGLTERSWRELIKLGAVRTVAERRGPGRIRQCDAAALKRAAAIGALNRAGLSLPVSGSVAYFLPFHTVLYEICDPGRILLQSSADLDIQTGLPPRIERPKVDWFDPDKPADADPEKDWLVEFYEARFVGVKYGSQGDPTIFGDLRETGTSFVAWFPNDARTQFTGSIIAELAQERLPTGARLIDAVVAWEDPRPWTNELRLLGYKFEQHDTDRDPLHQAAEATARSPVFKTTINVSLAIRKALRRYLGIEPAMSSYEMGEST